jgi:pimeloyl-ACP methyl ester carboxylesterase
MSGGKGNLKKGGIALAGSALLAAAVLPEVVRRRDHQRTDDVSLLLDDDLDLEHDFVTCDDGTSIHITATGRGDRVVFLVHGWVCNEKIFRFQQRALRDRYRVVTVELRGHGQSSVPENLDYSTERLGKDLKCVVDHVNPAEFVICGFSLGGFTTLKFYDEFSEECGDRLKAIALLDSSGTNGIEGVFLRPYLRWLYPFPVSGVLYLLGKYGYLFEWVEKLLRPLPQSYLFVRAVAFGRRPCGCHVELQTETAFNTRVTTVFLALKSVFDYHAEHILGDVRVPVLQFVGSRDKLTNVAANKRTAELLPDSRLVVFPDAGHDCLLERRDELNAELDSFLEDAFA